MQKAIKISTLITGIIWLSYLLDIILPVDFCHWGILPRDLSGLKGIVFAPFIHGGFGHILSNTPPIFILTLVLFKFYEQDAVKVWAGSALAGGLLVWILGRSSYHVGVSGVIFSLIGFLIATVIFKFNLKTLLIALAIFIFYGGTVIFGILPVNPYVSWEGHLFGLIAGVGISYYLYKLRHNEGSGKELN